jgi:hypothetical protein
VHFGAPSVDVDVKTNDLSVDLPETGIRGQATIELRDSAGNNPEAYHLNGIINSHQTSVSPNELLTRNVRITQSNLGGQPQILSVTPNEIFDKDNLVIVEGKNFGRVENVILLDQSLDFLTTGSTQISFTVPEDAHTGPLVIHTDSGPVYYTGIAVNYPPPEATPTPTPTFE